MRICGVDIEDQLGTEFRRGQAARILSSLTGDAEWLSFLRGLCLASLGNHEAARAAFVAASNAFPLACRVQQAYLDIASHRSLDAANDRLFQARSEAGDDDSLLGAIWHYHGIALGKQRQTAPAISALLESLRCYRRINDRWALAQVRDTLGTVEAARGKLEHAVQNYALALVDKSLLGDRLGMAITLGNLGRVHLRSGRFQDAIECFERDRDLCAELGDQRGLCRMHNDLGRTWAASGEWQRAEEALRSGYDLARTQKLSDIAFYCLKDLASLKIDQRDYLAAHRTLAEAKSLLTSESASYLSLAWDAVHGELLAAEGDSEAVAVLQRVVEAFHRSELPDWEIPARVALAQALLNQKQVYAAERCLLAGLRLARTNGYGRYFSTLNDTMTRLDISEGAELEQGRFLPTLGVTGAVDKKQATTHDYVIREKLGSGSFGTVYRAYDSQRGMEVALKTLPLSDTYDTTTRAALLQSTKTELAVASRVRHPGVVRVYAIGDDGQGDLYICQELVPGPSLRTWLKEREVGAVSEVVPLMLEAAFALDALHAVKVVHRDLKPDNILLRDGVHPVLIDFGIAQLRPPGWFARAEYTGTLEYMSPEQSQGRAVDMRTDLYAFGVILYELLAGRRPIRLPSDSWEEKASALQTQVPKPLSIFRPDVPPRLAALVHQLLEKKPRRRPSQARQVAEQLQSL